MIRRLSILLGLLCLLLLTEFQARATGPWILVPPTDSSDIGTNRGGPTTNRDWEGIMGIQSDVNDVIQTNQFVGLGVCNPTISIPGSALVMPTDGTSDCYAALQTAVTNVSGGTIVLPPGIFFFSKGVTIDSNNIFILGSGSSGANQTILWSSNSAPTILKFASHTDTSLGEQLPIQDDCPAGTNWFRVPLGATGTALTWKHAISQHSGFIWQDLSFIVTGLYPTNLVCSNGWAGESLLKVTNLTSQLVHIGTNFGTNGSFVYFTNDIPFTIPFWLTNGPSAYAIETPLTNVMVSGIRFINYKTNAAAANGLGTIMMDCCQQSGGFDLRVDATSKDGIFLVGCYQCQFQDFFLSYADFTDSADGYGCHFFANNFGCIFENGVVQGYRHSEIGESGNNCCAWAYIWNIGDNDVMDGAQSGNNKTNWCMNDFTLHAAVSVKCFVEGLFLQHPTVGDSVHGSGGMDSYLFRCMINHYYSNLTANILSPIGSTNLYWELGAPQTPFYPQLNMCGMSVDCTNNYIGAIGCIMDTPTEAVYTESYYAPLSPPNFYCFRFGWGPAGNGGEGGQFQGDLMPSNTFYIDGCYSFKTGTNQWYSGPDWIPNSCYLPNKGTNPPGWWTAPLSYSPGATLKWPPITPENGVNNMMPNTWADMPPSVIKWLGPWSNGISLLPATPAWDHFLMNH